MTNTDQYIKELEEFIKCREAASSGIWLNGYPNANQITPMPDHVWSDSKDLIAKDLIDQDAKFIALAANKSADIARNLIEALKVIEYIKAQLRAAIIQRHMLGEVAPSFDFICSKLEIDCENFLAKLNGVSK